jgi:hypothetical protein
MGHAAYSLWEDQTADRVVKRSGQSRLDGFAGWRIGTHSCAAEVIA